MSCSKDTNQMIVGKWKQISYEESVPISIIDNSLAEGIHDGYYSSYFTFGEDGEFCEFIYDNMNNPVVSLEATYGLEKDKVAITLTNKTIELPIKKLDETELVFSVDGSLNYFRRAD